VQYYNPTTMEQSSQQEPVTMTTATAITGIARTAVEIPCCLCGTMIYPNAANQCSTCLAQEFNLQGRLQRGPGGSDYVIIHQCRQCRRFQRTEKIFDLVEPESPELLSICLKHIPALSSPAEDLKLIEAGWVWTEPHSMRFRLKLTVRTEIQSVQVQQRVMVEMRCHWKQCPDCNREFTNRTWHALVQLRQKRADDAPRKGLAALEMALAKNKDIRKNVLRIDATKNGFDFYFLTTVHAQTFAGFLQRAAPMRVKTTKKLVSADSHSNTANLKYTITCDLVPFCREDLLLIHKSAKGKLSGRLALVTKVSSGIHLMDASPKRENLADSQMELSPEAYYKYEKSYSVLQASHRMIRFVVLDVEMCQDDQRDANGDAAADTLLYKGPTSGVSKFALADVQVARESDFGSNDEVFNCVTHLGHLMRPGDIVMGYDIAASVRADWEMQESFHNNFVLPDVVLVKKCGSGTAEPETKEQSDPQRRVTKKKERRRRRQEGKKAKELEESAVRMGFFEDDTANAAFERELESDPELAEELAALELNLAAFEEMDAEAASGAALGSDDATAPFEEGTRIVDEET